MSSLRRKIASRANGARSKGPVTEAGKKRSSANAIRHGLLARCVVLESESREGFDILAAGFTDRFNPADSVEVGFVEEMLAALWRQRRAWAIETKLMDDAVAAQDPEPGQRAQIAQAFAALAAQPQLGLLHRYEARLHRVFQRALHNLLLLKAETPPPSNCETNLIPKSDTPSGTGLPACPSETGSVPGMPPQPTTHNHSFCETNLVPKSDTPSEPDLPGGASSSETEHAAIPRAGSAPDRPPQPTTHNHPSQTAYAGDVPREHENQPITVLPPRNPRSTFYDS